MVHDVRGRLKVNETPCRSVTYANGHVEVSMDTGVRLVGDVRLAEAAVVGQLLYPGGGSSDVELRLRARDRYPPLLAWPTDWREPGLGPAAGPYGYRQPLHEPNGWPVAPAEDVGIDPKALEALVHAVVGGEAGVIHSLLVARSGALVLEEYFHGYRPDDLHPLRSCTKSVSSLLVGLAIEGGWIPDEESLVADFFPDPGLRSAFGRGWDRLTLKHLLTMTMALDWSRAEAADLHGTGPDFFRRVLSRSVSGSPGEDWAYVSANVNLLAGVLRETTGRHAEDFAREMLFEPLAIRAWDWEGMKTDGYNLMDGSLELRPRDMAKLGQVVLSGGTWGGTHLFEGNWVERSTAWSVDTHERFGGYGYLWWRTRVTGAGGERLEATLANGWGSQFVIVVPALDLVVVTTGGNDYNGKHTAVLPLVAELVRSLDRTGAG
jgi:CubicO group peptidase (beta-lactamase class C family)